MRLVILSEDNISFSEGIEVVSGDNEMLFTTKDVLEDTEGLFKCWDDLSTADA